MDQKSEKVEKRNKKPKPEKDIRESRIEEAFVKAVNKAGGLALKFTSQSMNGVPDRLVLFKIGKCAFVELKAPGKQMRPLQRKRRKQLEVLGFPVFCVDDFDQIEPVIQTLQKWNPGEPFPTGVGAVIPDIEGITLPEEEKIMNHAESEQAEQPEEQMEQSKQVEQEKLHKNQQIEFQRREPDSERPVSEQSNLSTSRGGDAT